MPWAIGALLIATFSGIFGAAMGISDPGRGMIHEEKTVIVEGASVGNWFDAGNQKNEESGGMPADPTATKAETETGAAAIDNEAEEENAAESVEIIDVRNKAKGAINSNEVENGNTVNVLAH